MRYKNFILLSLAVIFLFINFYLKPKETMIKNKYYDDMIIAAEKMKLIENEIFKEKIRRNIEVDENLDKNKTGLIGLEWSGITTTLGNLESKRTSSNPDFAALLVKVFKEAGLKKGDIVAANFSSSFPALNLAFIVAADTLELNPIIISSVGSSTYGANIKNFTYLDMEKYLFSKKLITNHSIAYSLGGTNDTGKDFEASIVNEIKTRLDSYNLKFFYEENLEKNIDNRYNFYKEQANKDEIKAFINIGGNLVSLAAGTDIINNKKILLDNSSKVKTGLVGKFFNDNVPIFYILNIKDIALYYGLEIDPDKFLESGKSKIYYEFKQNKNLYNFLIVFLFVFFCLVNLIYFKLEKNKFTLKT